MKPLILAFLLCLLPFVADAQTATSGVSLRALCMPVQSRDHIAGKLDVRPFAQGVDRDGDLWTLWVNPDGRWWLTLGMAKSGEHCDVVGGDGWSPAPVLRGESH